MGAAEKQDDVTPQSAPEFLSIEEAAVLLRVNRKTLSEMIKSDAPPWAKPIGRLIRIRRSALLRWFETEVVSPRKRRA